MFHLLNYVPWRPLTSVCMEFNSDSVLCGMLYCCRIEAHKISYICVYVSQCFQELLWLTKCVLGSQPPLHSLRRQASAIGVDTADVYQTTHAFTHVPPAHYESAEMKLALNCLVFFFPCSHHSCDASSFCVPEAYLQHNNSSMGGRFNF